MYKFITCILCSVSLVIGSDSNWKTAKEQLLKPYIEYSDYDPVTGKYGLVAPDKNEMDFALSEAQKAAEVEFNVAKVRGSSRNRLWKIDNEEQVIQNAREDLAKGFDPKLVSARLGRRLKGIREVSKTPGIGSYYGPTSLNVGPVLRALAGQRMKDEIASYAMQPSRSSRTAWLMSFFVPKFNEGPFMTKYEPQEVMRRKWYGAVSR